MSASSFVLSSTASTQISRNEGRVTELNAQQPAIPLRKRSTLCLPLMLRAGGSGIVEQSLPWSSSNASIQLSVMNTGIHRQIQEVITNVETGPGLDCYLQAYKGHSKWLPPISCHSSDILTNCFISSEKACRLQDERSKDCALSDLRLTKGFEME